MLDNEWKRCYNTTMKVGFTGTQTGLTDEQIELIVEVLAALEELTEMHHGDCIGADAQFYTIVRTLRPNAKIYSHPPTKDDKRAFTESDIVYNPKPYLDRNKDIVEDADVMIACPKEQQEILRSGTWATARHSRKTGVPLVIIYPDGKYEYED